MVFLPGNHFLDTNITVTNISRMATSGKSSSGNTATVVCNGSVGLSFTSMVEFKTHSLAFTHCGRSYAVHSGITVATLFLESIECVELLRCAFHDNFGTHLQLTTPTSLELVVLLTTRHIIMVVWCTRQTTLIHY